MRLSTKNESPNSEDFYTAIFDSIGSPILIIDSQTAAILDANESACKFYGYPYADFIQKKILDLAAIPSEEAWQRIQKIAIGEITHMTLPHRLASGEIRTVEVDLGTKKLGDKQVNIATVHDITEREQTKEKLQTSEERYHSLFSNMSEGFAVHEIIQDETGHVVDFRFLDANQAYEQHTGQKPEDIIGHTICETMPNADPAMIERYGNVALTGKPLNFEYYSKTFNRHIRVRSFRPQPNQFASIFEDITERKRAREKLKESEENYRLLFQNMREGFSLYEVLNDEHGQAVDARILAANEAYEKNTGLKPSEVIGKTLLEVKPVTDKRQLEPFFRVAQSGVPASIEFFSNGFQRYFHTTIFCPKSGHFATIVEDITDRKQAEAALQAAHDELEQRVQERTAELHESQQKYMALFKKAAVPAALTKMPEGVFVEVNEAFQGTFGYMNDEIYGKTSIDIGMVKPEERTETYIELERHGFVQNNEKHFRTKTGEKRDCLINVNPVSFNGRDFVITTIHDITERKQIEKLLNASEVRFRTLFEDSAVTMLLIEPNTGRIVNANFAAAKFYGYSREQLCYMNIKEINQLAPEEVAHEMQLAKEKKRNYFIFPHHLANGEVRTVEVRSNPIVMEQSTLLFSFVYDITEKIQNERQIHENQFRTEMAIRGANAGTWEWNVQTGETIFNEHWAQIVGYTLKELEPINIQTWIALCHPDDLKLSNEKLEKHFTGQTESYECEVRMKHKDGSWVWVFDSGKVMEWTTNGAPLRMFGTHLDITQSKQLENELRESEQKFTTLFEKSSIPALLFRLPDVVIENVNEAFEEVSGYQRLELLGKNIADLGIVPHAQHEQTVASFYEQGSIKRREALLFTKSRHERTILINVVPVSFGNNLYAITTLVDITERKQAEMKLVETNIALEKAMRTKDEFMAAMSHELRTPLNGIMGMTELLQMTAAGTLNEKHLKYLTNIEKSGKRLLDMVNNVLEFSQLQRSTQALDIQPCIVDDICRNALQKIAPLAEAKQQKLRFFANASNIKVSTDENRLKKILSLLLDNASKFTGMGSELGIEVISTMETGPVEITIWDAGIGIAETDFPQLFKPFKQLDASLARQYEGSGLGLALAKGQVELIGGTLTFQSTSGKGSRFTITLPRK